MAAKKSNSIYQGSLFEEDYLVRTLGALVHSPEIALTELVANAWDAGASKVDISIPHDYNLKLTVEDNGTGLTKDQFEQRWMRLGYNRIKHQGKNVIFPPKVQGKRLAYGRTGGSTFANRFKPTRRPKFAKELPPYQPGKNYFLKSPSLLKILKPPPVNPTEKYSDSWLQKSILTRFPRHGRQKSPAANIV